MVDIVSFDHLIRTNWGETQWGETQWEFGGGDLESLFSALHNSHHITTSVKASEKWDGDVGWWDLASLSATSSSRRCWEGSRSGPLCRLRSFMPRLENHFLSCWNRTVVTMLECHCSLKYHSVVFTPLMISWTCANENDATHQSLFNRNVLLFKEMLLIYVWHWDWLIPPCFMLSNYMASIAWQRSEGQMLGLVCERTHHMMFLVHSCF